MPDYKKRKRNYDELRLLDRMCCRLHVDFLQEASKISKDAPKSRARRHRLPSFSPACPAYDRPVLM